MIINNLDVVITKESCECVVLETLTEPHLAYYVEYSAEKDDFGIIRLEDITKIPSSQMRMVKNG